ncbi:MAG: nitroreductase family protein [Elusimicrobia bacterium]|nr:nitroreductase family protein [Elusimicrobiota bacterium]
MENLEMLKARRSVRSYQDKTLNKDDIEKIVDCARFAATARNVQPWEFVAVTEGKTLESLAALAENGRFLAQAKACIAVFCVDTKYYLEDGCAATQNLLLAASMLGIGSCWVAGDKKPYVPQVSALLGAPAQYKLVSLVALGHPRKEDQAGNPRKRPLKEVLHWEKF